MQCFEIYATNVATWQQKKTTTNCELKKNVPNQSYPVQSQVSPKTSQSSLNWVCPNFIFGAIDKQIIRI